MESGYVLLNTIVLLLIGIAGAGKTSFCHMLFGEPPPIEQKSTPLAQSSIRAVSFTRATVPQTEGSILWERVSPSMLSSLIADGIKAFSNIKSNNISSKALTDGQLLVVDSTESQRSRNPKPVSHPHGTGHETSLSLAPIASTGSGGVRPLSDIDQLFEMDHI